CRTKTYIRLIAARPERSLAAGNFDDKSLPCHPPRNARPTAAPWPAAVPAPRSRAGRHRPSATAAPSSRERGKKSATVPPAPDPKSPGSPATQLAHLTYTNANRCANKRDNENSRIDRLNSPRSVHRAAALRRRAISLRLPANISDLRPQTSTSLLRK